MVCCSLFTVRCLLFVVWCFCLSFGVYGFSFVVCRCDLFLYVVCCLLFVVVRYVWLLFVVGGWLLLLFVMCFLVCCCLQVDARLSVDVCCFGVRCLPFVGCCL